jgi:hypothetical protein
MRELYRNYRKHKRLRGKDYVLMLVKLIEFIGGIFTIIAGIKACGEG